MKTKLIVCLAAAALAMHGCSKDNLKKKTEVNTPQAKRASALTGSYGVYSITCVNGGKSFDVKSNFFLEEKLALGTKIQLWQTPSASTAEKWQKWYVVQSGSYYKLFNLFSGKFLDNYGNTANQGVQQDQYDENTSDAQLYSITSVGTNIYKIVNKYSGLALTNEGNNGNNGNAVTQRTYTGSTSQHWYFNNFPLESYRDDAVTRYFMRTSGTVAWDGNQSVPLTYGSYNGKQMWLTNDEYYNQLNGNGKINCYGTTIEFFHKNNAAMIQPSTTNWNPASTSNLILNSGTYQEEIFHDLAGNVLWPGAGVEIGSKVYVTNVEVSGLSLINQYLGIIDLSTNTSSTTPVSGYTNQTTIEYSIGMVKDGTTVYVFGKDGGLSPNVYVAKFSTGTPTSWTFWNGSTWAAAPSTAVAARIRSGLPSGAINVAKVGSKFVMVANDLGIACNSTGKQFYSWTSTAANAAFGNQQTIYKLPDTYQNNVPIFYTPVIHPQFTNGRNELLITYCTNFWDNKTGGGNCIEKCTGTGADPNGYRPKAFRVPYSIIGI